MTCQSLQSIYNACDSGIVGGVASVYVAAYTANTAGSAYTWTNVIEKTKEGSTYVEALSEDIGTGAGSVKSTLTIVISKREEAKMVGIRLLAAGQRDLAIKVFLNSDPTTPIYMGAGSNPGANLMSANTTSGSKLNDPNNITLVFEATSATFN